MPCDKADTSVLCDKADTGVLLKVAMGIWQIVVTPAGPEFPVTLASLSTLGVQVSTKEGLEFSNLMKLSAHGCLAYLLERANDNNLGICSF